MQDYLNLHVTRKMREIMHRWFHVDLQLCDANGKVVGSGTEQAFDAKNPLIQALQKSENCLFMINRSFAETAKKLKRDGASTIPKVMDSFAGLKRLVVCLFQDGHFLGFVSAEGIRLEAFSTAEIDHIVADLPDRNINRKDLEKAFKEIPVLAPNQMDYVRDLVRFVADEILAFQKEISVKDKQISRLNDEIGNRYKFDAIIGRSKPMVEVYRLLDKVIDSDSTVLIFGENGTGKELIAKAIHYNSPRKDKVFVVQNCSAFNDNLLDSELFGHVKGSFTGAISDKKGLFEIADKGTFFLDEIGDMSAALQVSLLRVLQEGTLIGVGDVKQKNVDVRIVAATNKDLKELVDKGLFREDLYYRVNVINIRLPPLRERREDIPLLIDHFLYKYNEGKGKRKKLSKKCIERFFEYDWPGNIRELENEIERLMVLSDEDPVIEEELLSPRMLNRIKSIGESDVQPTAAMQAEGAASNPNRELESLPVAVEKLEREIIEEGLKKTRWNKSKLARVLGISRRNLIRKIEKYELDKRRRMEQM